MVTVGASSASHTGIWICDVHGSRRYLKDILWQADLLQANSTSSPIFTNRVALESTLSVASYHSLHLLFCSDCCFPLAGVAHIPESRMEAHDGI